MAETAERVFVNRIGKCDSYSLGFVSTKRTGKPRSERQLSCNKTLEGTRFRFISASFVGTDNLQLLESTHKLADRLIYARIDMLLAKGETEAHRNDVVSNLRLRIHEFTVAQSPWRVIRVGSALGSALPLGACTIYAFEDRKEFKERSVRSDSLAG